MRYRDLSLRAKVQFMIIQITVFNFLSMGAELWTSSMFQKQLSNMIEIDDHYDLQLSRLDSRVHETEIAASKFELSKSETWQKKRDESVKALAEDLKKLQGIDKNLPVADEYKSLHAHVEQFEDIFRVNAGSASVSKTSIENLENSSESLNAAIQDLDSSTDKQDIESAFQKLNSAQIDFLSTHSTGSAAAAMKQLDRLARTINLAKVSSRLEQEVERHRDAVSTVVKQLTSENSSAAKREEMILLIETKIEAISAKISEHKQTELASMERFEHYCGYFRSCVLIFVLAIGFFYSFEVKRISDSLQEISERVKHTTQETSETSYAVQEAAEKVSTSTNQQASAVQETVATLNQITAMVNRSVEGAAASAEKATISYQIASEGKQSVNQMRQAMQEIQHNIDDMTVQVDNSNKQFEGIVQIINEIVNKTQVINDIVFQTKLLSFNASVEAARAGEHGKGFAVVAEEVGNLAQMSGQAAREIGELLTKSRGNVEQIIKESKSQMQVLVKQGGERVKNGSDLANRCEDILQEVVVNVNSVKKLMEEISSAAKEEAEGVHNITIAMNEIDSTTHANADTAHQTMGYSTTLAKQADELSGIIRNLDQVVRGKNATGETVRRAPPESHGKGEKSQNVLPIQRQQPRVVKSDRNAEASRQRGQRPDPNDPGFEEVG